MSIKNWVLTRIFGGTTKAIQVGTRVKYQGHLGTVIGGTLHVKFDERPSFLVKKTPGQDNYKTASFNIDKNNIEVV